MELAVLAAAALTSAAATVAGARYVAGGAEPAEPPSPADYGLRLDVLLALDEHIDESGPWARLNITMLLKHVHAHLEMPAAPSCPRRYLSLVRGAMTMVAFCGLFLSDDVLSISNMADEQLVLGGFPGHAIGFLFRKLDGGARVEVAVHNAGLGCAHHGINPTPTSPHHPECAGIIVFEPVGLDAFVTFLRVADFMSSGALMATDNDVLSIAFYRVALEPLYDPDGVYGTAAANAPTTLEDLEKLLPFRDGWEIPFVAEEGGVAAAERTSHPHRTRVSHHMMLPMQTTGDCVLRALLFTPLASPDVTPRQPSAARLATPAWFWNWYAERVAAAALSLLGRDGVLRLTQAELCALQRRLYSMEAFCAKAGTDGGPCAAARDACAARCIEWYTRVLAEPEPEHLVRPRVEPCSHHDSSAFLDTDNTMHVEAAPPLDYDLVAAVGAYRAARAWSEVAAALTSKADNALSRAELVALTDAAHRLLSADAASSMHSEAEARAAVAVSVYIVSRDKFEFPRVFDAGLMYALCYAAIRRAVEHQPGIVPAKQGPLLDKLFASFTPLKTHAWCDGPVYNRRHAATIEYAIAQLDQLHVIGDASASLSSAAALYCSYFPDPAALKLRAFPELTWKACHVYVHALVECCNLAKSRSDEQVGVGSLGFGAALLFVATYFQYGCSLLGVPLVLNDLQTGQFFCPPVDANNINLQNCDLLNPFKRSIDALFDVDAPDISVPSDFMLRHGKKTTGSQMHEAGHVRPLDYWYGNPAQVLSATQHLPPPDVGLATVKRWAERLSDYATDRYVRTLTLDEWNLLAYAVIYLACQYSDEDIARHRVRETLHPLCELPQCRHVVRAFVGLLPAGQSEGNTPAAAQVNLWTRALNNNCDGLSEVPYWTNDDLRAGIYSDDLKLRASLKLGFSESSTILQMDYRQPANEDIMFDFALTHLCHEIVGRWGGVGATATFNVMQVSMQKELSSGIRGKFEADSCLNREVAYLAVGAGAGAGEEAGGEVFSATFSFQQHFARRITAEMGPFRLHETTFRPVHAATHRFTIVERDGRGGLTLRVLEPLPPHPVFQTEFTWTPVGGSGTLFSGVPTSLSLLKAHNYSLEYDAGNKVVTQRPPPNGSAAEQRCDSALLSAGADTQWQFLPLGDALDEDKGCPQLVELCARLLLFAYADTMLVWAHPGSGWKVELLRHGAVFLVPPSAPGAPVRITMPDGLALVRSAPAAGMFWMRRMPSVFWAESKDDDGSLRPHLLVLDVQRRDPGVVPSCAMARLFGDDGTDMNAPVDPGSCPTRQTMKKIRSMQLEPMSCHRIPVHSTTPDLLLPPGLDQLVAFAAVAEHFGRTDVAQELARMTHALASVNNNLPAAASAAPNGKRKPTNFARFSSDNDNSSSILTINRFDFKLRDLDALPSPMPLRRDVMYILRGTIIPLDSHHVVPALEQSLRTVPLPPLLAAGAAAAASESELLVLRGPRFARGLNILPGLMKRLQQKPAGPLTDPPLPSLYAELCHVTGRNAYPAQLQVAHDIHSEFQRGDARIHNLIMGGGKTSMVTPLVVLHSLYDAGAPDAPQSVVLVTPEKLLAQTLQIAVPLLLYLDVPVEVVSDKSQLELQQQPTLYLASDRVIKECVVQGYRPRAGLRFLIDEADMLMNPLTSELNTPDSTVHLQELLREAHPDAPHTERVVEDLADAVLAPPSAVPPEGGRLASIVASTAAHARSRTHRLHYGHLVPPERVRRIVDLLATLGPSQVSGISAQLFAQLVPSSESERAAEPSNYYRLLVREALAFHARDVLAVPYTFADVPSEGSEFADPLLTLAFTAAALARTGLSELRLYVLQRAIAREDESASVGDSPEPGAVPDQQSAPAAAAPAAAAAAWITSCQLAENPWAWLREHRGALAGDAGLQRKYLLLVALPAVRVFRETRSACGMDLVMAGRHALRSGFTGTPEQLVVRDTNPVVVLPKVECPDEDTAMSKLQFVQLPADADDSSGKKHGLRGVAAAAVARAAAFGALVDVGSELLGLTPAGLLCALVEERGDAALQLAYWDAADRPCVVDAAGTVSQWDRAQRANQVVYYDNAHTTGTDATLLSKLSACVTVRDDTTYRDFIQGLFRLRKIAREHDTRCAVLLPPSLAGRGIDGIAGFRAWLEANSAAVRAQQAPLRCMHNAMAFLRAQKVPKPAFTTVRSAADCLRRESDASQVDYVRATVADADAAASTDAAVLKALAADLQALDPDAASAALLIGARHATAQATAQALATTEVDTEVLQRMRAERRSSSAFPAYAAESPPLRFAVLYTPPTSQLADFFDLDPSSHHHVSKRFAVYDHDHRRFRALRLSVAAAGTAAARSTTFVLTFPEGMLLMDHLASASASAADAAGVEMHMVLHDGGASWFTSVAGVRAAGRALNASASASASDGRQRQQLPHPLPLPSAADGRAYCGADARHSADAALPAPAPAPDAAVDDLAAAIQGAAAQGGLPQFAPDALAPLQALGDRGDGRFSAARAAGLAQYAIAVAGECVSRWDPADAGVRSASSTCGGARVARRVRRDVDACTACTACTASNSLTPHDDTYVGLALALAAADTACVRFETQGANGGAALLLAFKNPSETPLLQLDLRAYRPCFAAFVATIFVYCCYAAALDDANVQTSLDQLLSSFALDWQETI
jgi:hypothetical protein